MFISNCYQQSWDSGDFGSYRMARDADGALGHSSSEEAGRHGVAPLESTTRVAMTPDLPQTETATTRARTGVDLYARDRKELVVAERTKLLEDMYGGDEEMIARYKMVFHRRAAQHLFDLEDSDVQEEYETKAQAERELAAAVQEADDPKRVVQCARCKLHLAETY